VTCPRIIAHRCGGALAPENSLVGLEIAARLGCHGVEFDAMLSADGVPVLIHDETLERTTDGHGRVDTASFEVLRGLDVGIRHHRAFAGERVPTLEAALATCARLGLWANVEIKPAGARDEATGAEVARAAAGFRDVLLSSFSVGALRAAAGAVPALPRALLLEQLVPNWEGLLEEMGVSSIHVAHQALDADTLAILRSAQIRVAAYTVNTRARAEQLFSEGIAAVFTDRPDLWLADEM